LSSIRIASARHVHLFLDLAVELVADLLGRHGLLGLAARALEIVDGRHDLADRLMRRVERADHFLLGRLFRAGLDHHDRVGAARDNQVHLALLALA
jgi:hypothetical protein